MDFFKQAVSLEFIFSSIVVVILLVVIGILLVNKKTKRLKEKS